MTSSTDFEPAMDAARKAADSPVDGFVERLAERIGARVNVRTVFGEAIERDGITVIPVAKVRWGFGGGAGGPVQAGPGRDDDGAVVPDASAGPGAAMGTGQGGGGGATADPVGWIEIGPDGAVFKPIIPAMPSPGFLLAAGATAALVLRGLAKLLRR
ncbi:MAG: hypothetical protein ABI620_07850 [Chloroflexota bacterium]